MGDGNAHCNFYSTFTHYVEDSISPCFGDGKPHVLREVKWLAQRCPASKVMKLDGGSVGSWSNVFGIPHSSLLLIIQIIAGCGTKDRLLEQVRGDQERLILYHLNGTIVQPLVVKRILNQVCQVQHQRSGRMWQHSCDLLLVSVRVGYVWLVLVNHFDREKACFESWDHWK